MTLELRMGSLPSFTEQETSSGSGYLCLLPHPISLSLTWDSALVHTPPMQAYIGLCVLCHPPTSSFGVSFKLLSIPRLSFQRPVLRAGTVVPVEEPVTVLKCWGDDTQQNTPALLSLCWGRLMLGKSSQI